MKSSNLLPTDEEIFAACAFHVNEYSTQSERVHRNWIEGAKMMREKAEEAIEQAKIEQAEEIYNWLLSWDRLKQDVVPLRFKEEFINQSKKV